MIVNCYLSSFSLLWNATWLVTVGKATASTDADYDPATNIGACVTAHSTAEPAIANPSANRATHPAANPT